MSVDGCGELITHGETSASSCWQRLSDGFLAAVSEGLGPFLLVAISLSHNHLHICPWLMLCLAVALCDIWSSSVFRVCCYF